MDKYVKQSIDGRKEAIFNAYEVGAEGKKKVEALFMKIEKMGVGCKDVGEFEAEFAKSPLNQEYLDLFTEIATGSQPVDSRAGTEGAGAKVGGIVVEGIVKGTADRALGEVERAVLPTRAAVNQAVSDEMRKVPVLGDAIDLGQKASYAAHFGKLFGKRKKK